jgi:prepilin peptidase CpaA
MNTLHALSEAVIAHWPIWLVSITLIVAAVIDGFELKVPNAITFPMILGGWLYSALAAGAQQMPWWEGLGWSLLGTLVGLLLLLPAYAIGGMGAGDVKLLAGVGAWVHSWHTVQAFSATVVVGACLAVLMVLASGQWRRHLRQAWWILNEIVTIRNPEVLSQIAGRRKPTMLLLPYGIPIAMGTIAYFAWNGMLV